MRRVSIKVHDIGGNLLGKSYYKLLVEAKLALARETPPVLIWQMGKVGSSSVVASLKNHHKGPEIFHAHVLNRSMIYKRSPLYLYRRILGHRRYLYFDAIGEALLRDSRLGRRWKIITIVREPVARNLSAFFQNIHLYVPEAIEEFQQLDREEATELLRLFFERYDHSWPLDWFDSEIRDVLGVDVLACGFDFLRKYKMYSAGNVDLLVIRLDEINTVGRDAITEFLGLENFELLTENVGAAKDYGRAYDHLRTRVKFPTDYLDFCYQSRYAQTFYTPEELRDFRQTWRSEKRSEFAVPTKIME